MIIIYAPSLSSIEHWQRYFYVPVGKFLPDLRSDPTFFFSLNPRLLCFAILLRIPFTGVTLGGFEAVSGEGKVIPPGDGFPEGEEAPGEGAPSLAGCELVSWNRILGTGI